MIVLDCVRFIKDALPEHILFENAKEFFGFSLPMSEDLSAHPIAARLQQELNGRTIGEYLKDELTAEGLEYDLNFDIEDACFYGTAQSRVRSILLGSRTGTWKFPKTEEFAMPFYSDSLFHQESPNELFPLLHIATFPLSYTGNKYF